MSRDLGDVLCRGFLLEGIPFKVSHFHLAIDVSVNLNLFLLIESSHLLTYKPYALPKMGYKVRNVYVIAAVAVVGGALFGFDISSMSAIISTDAYLCYFNQNPDYLETTGKCSGPTPSVQGRLPLTTPWISYG